MRGIDNGKNQYIRGIYVAMVSLPESGNQLIFDFVFLPWL